MSGLWHCHVLFPRPHVTKGDAAPASSSLSRQYAFSAPEMTFRVNALLEHDGYLNDGNSNSKDGEGADASGAEGDVAHAAVR